MHHACTTECQFLNRDNAWVCSQTGKVGHQLICSNEISGETNDLSFVPKARATGTNGRKKYTRNSRAAPDFTEPKVRKEVEDFVIKLLYSDKRSLCQHQKAKRVDAVKSVSAQHHKKRRVIETIERNEEELGLIVDQVFQILKMIHEAKPFVKKKPIILGTLFLMQYGKKFTTRSGTVFKIVRSKYLWKHLPSISDLNLFGFEKSLVRIGKNAIQQCAREL